MAFRAFISIDVGGNPRIAEFCEDLRRSGKSLKVVKPDTIHVTLKFLGDTEENVIPDIRRVMEESARDMEPFDLHFQGAGSFPGRTKIRVVWVGIENPQEVVALASRIDAGLQSLGFPKEGKSFSPHLTVARSRNDFPGQTVIQTLEKYRSVDFGTQRVGGIRLKKSVLEASGPTYSTVEEVVLSSRSSHLSP